MANRHLAGHCALVTGGSRGIGYATAARLLDAGARVVVTGLDPDRLETAVGALASRGEVEGRVADVRDASAVHDLVERVTEYYGGLDILVNNARVAWSGAFVEQSRESIDAHLDINVRAVLHGCRAALPAMLARGGGTIVNVSSGAGRSGIPELATYSATKFAINGLTEALAGEVSDHGVRVFAVCPGRVATDMQEQVSGRRQGMDPTRVANAIVSLCGAKPSIEPRRYLEL